MVHILLKFEQNCMVRTYTNFWAFIQKMVKHFWQSVEAIMEDVFVIETIVWC